MPFIKTKNYRIYYEAYGEGEAIFFMHHGFGCMKIWKDIYPSFVDEGFKVVMFDRRGYGRSEPGDNFMDFYVSDSYRPDSVEELRTVKEHLGIETCHLVAR